MLNQTARPQAVRLEKAESIQSRPNTACRISRDCISDDISFNRYRAFEIAHKQSIQSRTELFQKELEKEERIRNLNKKGPENHEKKQLLKDQKLLETIVQKRKDGIRTIRERNGEVPAMFFPKSKLPKEDGAYYPKRDRVFFWG